MEWLERILLSGKVRYALIYLIEIISLFHVEVFVENNWCYGIRLYLIHTMCFGGPFSFFIQAKINPFYISSIKQCNWKKDNEQSKFDIALAESYSNKIECNVFRRILNAFIVAQKFIS